MKKFTIKISDGKGGFKKLSNPEGSVIGEFKRSGVPTWYDFIQDQIRQKTGEVPHGALEIITHIICLRWAETLKIHNELLRKQGKKIRNSRQEFELFKTEYSGQRRDYMLLQAYGTIPEYVKMEMNEFARIYDLFVETMTEYFQDNSLQPGPTTDQIALFFYYLLGSKEEGVELSKLKDFLNRNKYKNTLNSVRNRYYAIGKGDKPGKPDPMNLKNLSYVIGNLLSNYPIALKSAMNDHNYKMNSNNK